MADTHQSLLDELAELQDSYASDLGALRRKHRFARLGVQDRCAQIGHVTTAVDGPARMPTLFPGEGASGEVSQPERLRRCVICGQDEFDWLTGRATKDWRVAGMTTRFDCASSESLRERGAVPGRDVDVMLRVDPAKQGSGGGAAHEDGALSSVEADLALVVSRGLVTIDRFKGVDEDALRNGAKDVLGSLAFALLGCSELLRRISKLRVELSKRR